MRYQNEKGVKFYQIAEMEQLSGIKAHTIRIWEKRYELVKPERTDTNIRLYNDDQVRKLLNVVTLLNSGMKISRIAEMSQQRMHEQIKDIEKNGHPESIIETYVNQLISAMLEFDEYSFTDVFSRSQQRFGLEETMMKVIYPFLRRTGVIWSTNEAAPVQEHFASALIKRKLLASIDSIGAPANKTTKVVLLLPPGEWHEIALIFSNYILRANGIATVYLGQNVPYENIPLIIESVKPTHVLTFFIARRDKEELTNIRKRMGLPENIRLLIAGNPEIMEHIKMEEHVSLLHSPNELLNNLTS